VNRFVVELVQLVVSLWTGDGDFSYRRDICSVVFPELLSEIDGFHAIAGNWQKDWKFISVLKLGNQLYSEQ
jgi:hypothetical protein